MPRKKNKGRGANNMGSVRQKKVMRNGKPYIYWEGRCTVGHDPETGKQIQRSVTGKTQAEVSQKLTELMMAVNQGTYQPPSKLTLKGWLEIWQRGYLGDVKESTAYLYSRNIELYILPRLGAVMLDKLTAPMIQALYNDLLKPENKAVRPLSPKTVRNIHGVLHKALQQAVQLGYLRNNLSDACKLPKVKEKEIKPLEDNHINDFLEAVEGHPYEYLYKIALFTGIRQGELLGLTWDCVDLDKGELNICKQVQKKRQKGGQYYMDSTKSNKSRPLAIGSSLVRLFRLQKLKVESMKKQSGAKWQEHNLVFPRANGTFFSSRTAYNAFKRIMVKIGSPSTRFHDLRHTYATLAFQNGDDVKTVQGNLGHATADFTLKVYAHVTDKMRRDSADRMEQRMEQLTQSIPA